MPVSIREVASPAGVSVGTVSNVLNRPEIVAQLTRDRVQASIRELGFVSIVGYDDIDFAAAAVPLTSVRQPRQQPGRTAARLLLDEAADDETHQHRQVIFEPELVVRQSTQPAALPALSPSNPAR